MSERSSQKSAAAPPTGSDGVPLSSTGGSSRSHIPGETDGQRTVISQRPPLPPLLSRVQPAVETAGLLEGEQLGQFLLQKFVGGGGMGIVFRALDTTLNREVAVKVLSRDQSADEETLRRFRNEAQSAARLNHDNIARVHYVGEDRGVHYIVFEFIEGINIRDLVEQRGPLPLAEAVSYTFQIAQALEHASQRAVIHRDIKPSNVLITPDGKAKLVDMGLARLNQVAQATDDLTASGVTLGTFDYISPEQARDPRMADVRSDLYSLGCSFFYMLTGRPPFPDGTVLQKLLQHQADQAPDPRVFRPDLPGDITRILARLLAKNPANRYQLPEELSQELAALGPKLGLQISGAHPVVTVPRPILQEGKWRKHWPWAVPMASLFLVVAALEWHGAAGRPAPPKNRRPARTGSETETGNSPEIRSRAAEPPARSAAVEPAKASATTAEPSVEPSPTETASEPTAATAPSTGKPAPVWLKKWFERAPSATAAQAPAGTVAPLAGESPATKSNGSEPREGNGNPRPATVATTDRDNVLTVADETGPRIYPTLHAACSNAKNGDIIELRFNGRRAELPFTLANIRLTIRAGEGFEPVVVFRPEANPVKYPPSMVIVAGGQLKVSDVHWELDLPRDLPADWSLVETRHAELVQFERSTFTIRNASPDRSAYHAGVAFFDVKAPAGSGIVAMDPAAIEDQPVVIDLHHCLVRGEADFLRSNELQSLRLNWTNGLLATSERFLVAAGGPTRPHAAGLIQINLRHVTAATQRGLALLANSQDAPYLLPLEWNCDDCVFLTRANAPLIEQRGSDLLDESVRRLQWRANRDYFDGFDVFWRIAAGLGQSPLREQRFDEWQEYWRGQSRSQHASAGDVRWAGLPDTDRAIHSHAPSDFALDANDEHNLALGGAGDGLDAGMILQQMPGPPPGAGAMSPRPHRQPPADEPSRGQDATE